MTYPVDEIIAEEIQRSGTRRTREILEARIQPKKAVTSVCVCVCNGGGER